ncbi:MAG: hypothetical protein ACK4GC_03515 [Paracoccaceae bacterium]
MPGKVASSDTNFQLIGGTIDTVSGKDLPKLFADEVFSPLRPRDTHIKIAEARKRVTIADALCKNRQQRTTKTT